MKNILIVDDDVLMRLVMTTSMDLALRDVSCLTAASGKQAIDILDSRPVHFVLTDIFMGDMSGFQLIEYMKERHPNVPVAAMSGEGGAATMKRLQELGITQFFEKPFNMKRVLDTITAITMAEGDADMVAGAQGMTPSEGGQPWA